MTSRAADRDEGSFLFGDLVSLGALALLGYGGWLWYQQNAGGVSTAAGGDPGADDTSSSTTSMTSTPSITIINPPATSSSPRIQPGNFTVSAAGEAAIKNIEQLRLTAYKDGAGRSIGYGHQIVPADNIANTITAARAEQLFNNDIAKVEQAMNARIFVPLTQGQVDAIGDFVFSVGIPHFQSSTMLKKLNAGDYAGASAELGRWTHSSGKVLSALVSRRAYEQQIWST